ncbi:50S ribosomal protein L31 [Desulfonatronospira sp.]|uniref:50S ribosomal protein L31 n=1 Tax=Desulfonatronospira sp. TaxID=1962951 RepID=UPI0025BF5175|nr:50S ribosomal protein L31 [Desulfonatronospira sp.]
MKKNLHPSLHDTKIKCACGSEFESQSTAGREITVEVCSQCHPFFTGQQRFVDSAGRIDRFKKKYGQAAQ